RLLGPARARALALTAEPVSADQAETWGLIWKAHDDGELMSQAHGLCARFAAAPAVALALIKRLLDESWSNDLDTQLDLEREAQREASLSPDYAEGVHAFLQKRRRPSPAPGRSRMRGSSRARSGPGNHLLRGGIWMSSASCSLLNGASMNLSFTASLWIPAMSFISSVCRASLG